MSKIIVDECFKYLMEAQEYADKYVELDDFQLMFEASNPDVVAQQQANAEASAGASSKLKSAIAALRKVIKNILDAISNFFKEVTASKDEKKLLAEFREACKKDPSLKNKRVTITDYRNYIKEYNALLAEAERIDRELAKGKETPIDKISKDIGNFIAGAAAGVGASVAVDFALNCAASNEETARIIKKGLEFDQNILDKLEKDIGEKGAKNFKKDVNSCGKRISLRKLIIRMRRGTFMNVTDAWSGTMDNVKDLFSVGGFAKSAMSKDGIARNMLRNEQIGGAAKDVVSTSAAIGMQGAKMTLSAKKQDKKDAKLEKKMEKRHAKGDYSQDSAFSFLKPTRKKDEIKETK